MPLLQSIRAYLGWCPVAGPAQATPPVHPGFDTAGAPGGTDGPDEMAIPPGWWHRYHNQMLILAIAVSVATALLHLAIEEVPGRYLSLGIFIGVGSGIGLWLGQRKRYGQVADGAFARPRGNREKRATRYIKSVAIFSAPASFVLMAAGVACFVLLGMVWAVFAFLVGMSITWWNGFVITVVWERRHRMTLVADRGWMYAVDSAMPGDDGKSVGVQ